MLVAGQGACAADVALRGAGGERGHRHVDAVASTSRSATSAAVGVRSGTWRVRDWIVGRTSSTLGAQRIHTVCGGGSSMALSSMFTAVSVSRSASSSTITCHGLFTGDMPALWMSSRASFAVYDRPSVVTTSTSACPPSGAVRHASHTPHPSSGHTSAAAKQVAAVERPEPGGPVMSQACVMPGPGSPRRMCSASVDRSRQLLDHGVLADEPLPDLAGISAPRARTRTRARMAAATSSMPPPRVEHEVAIGLGLGQCEERRPHCSVVLERLGLEPVALARTGPGPPRGRRRAPR